MTVTNSPTATNIYTSTATATNTPTTPATATNPYTSTATATAIPPAVATATTNPAFPQTGILDDYNRSDGSIGTSWGGKTTGFNLIGNRLIVGTGGDIYWKSPSFGANQEAFVTFTVSDPVTTEVDLILKSQSSASKASGLLEVLYNPAKKRIRVYTYTVAQGWMKRGMDIRVAFMNGDQFGARTTENGLVYVYRNGVLLETVNVTGWPYYPNGGYIGLWVHSPSNSILDNFGGGTP